jgi:steroid 5-alpha reductase family enzyme
MLHTALNLTAIGGSLLAGMMLVLWWIHLRIANAGIVDIGWAYGLGILAVVYAALGTGNPVRRWTMAAMVAIWSTRLGTHLFRRVVGKPEEGRYRQLREQWKTGTAWKFLLFFEAQALLDLLLGLPFLLVSVDPAAGTASGASLGPLHWAGISIWLIAVLGESVADAQLARFKKTAHGTGVCQIGLWNYSRHPNYFFEWLVWVGWALFALSAPLGWTAWLAPALIFFFLFKVTGIPATEAQALRSKGAAYSTYQKTTSVFVPWFKKTGSA